MTHIQVLLSTKLDKVGPHSATIAGTAFKADTSAAAAALGDVEIASMLVASGATVNQQDHDGRTALHWAAASARPKVLEILLLAGKADGSIKTESGDTAFDLAILPNSPRDTRGGACAESLQNAGWSQDRVAKTVFADQKRKVDKFKPKPSGSKNIIRFSSWDY